MLVNGYQGGVFLFDGVVTLNCSPGTAKFSCSLCTAPTCEPAHCSQVRFRRIKAPNRDELIRLTHTIAHRIGRYLERQGLLERDTGNIYLTPEAMDASDEDPSIQLLGSSITYRIALGPQQGRKVFA